ncbi:MAG: trimeric autotransporter adhesin, partial [Mycobacterium sp.]|nr:trimeric autotransporter adhesin [Mycobacterium sp.]
MADNSIQLDSGGSYLFVGNSFTFGRVDPVMSYNAANVRDLTAPVPGTTFANTTGSNPYEPHPWGGVPGLFEAFASQSGLELDVAISARNAATLQGQYLNSNPAGWDLRGNVASQAWDVVVLQDNSTQPLPSGSGSITFAAGSSTATLTIDPMADTKVETDETIGLQITPNSAYRTSAGVVTGTILNDDPTGPVVNPALSTVTLVASPGAVLEDSPDKLVYTFTRTGPTTSALTVNFTAFRDGSTAPSVASGSNADFVVTTPFTGSFVDNNGHTTTGTVSFTNNNGSIVIPAGATSVTFTLDPKTDTTVEPDESIRLTLSADAAYNVGTPGPVSVTILNDDFAPGTDLSVPNISLGLASSGVYEDGSGNLVYAFTRTGPNAAPLTVNFSVSGTATLAGNDFTVTGANSFSSPGAADPDLQSFKTYAVKLAQYATTGAADGAVPANPHANAATDVYLYETWARPNMVTGALVANTDDTTGAVTTTTTTAPEYYLTLEAMTADLRAAYEGLAAANPIFAGVAPVGAAFLAAVQDGTAMRNPYAPDAGKIDLWWDDNLHASKYGSYLSGLTLFGTLTGLDPRSLGAAEHVASDLGITQAVAAALQNVAAATLGFTLDAHWTAPGQVTELQGGVTGLLATEGSFGFSDSDVADTHTIAVAALTPGSVGTFSAAVHTDTTGDGTGGSVDWLFTVDNADVAFLSPGATRVEHFLVTISDANGGSVQRDVAVTLNGTYNDAPGASM